MPRRGSVEAAVAPVLVVGLGNRLLRDDGVGLELLSKVEPNAAAWGRQVELMDGGTRGLALLGELAGREELVFLDAIRMGADPGAVHMFRAGGLGRMGSRATTAHEGGVTEILGALALLGETPQEVTVIGVEPGEIETGIGLSKPVAAALEEAAALAVDTIEKAGLRAGRRSSNMCLAVPGKILETQVVRNNRLGLVQFGGTRRPVFLDLVPEAATGDYVLVHVGFAISKVNEEEARRTYELLEKTGQLQAEEINLEAEEAEPAMARRSKPR